ncbi:MAG: hypothetical protein JHD16_05490 [Solirubrobacteraceae bacterium]|nr:hypothetical protein [Solirubrobacteraceae bacterium]
MHPSRRIRRSLQSVCVAVIAAAALVPSAAQASEGLVTIAGNGTAGGAGDGGAALSAEISAWPLSVEADGGVVLVHNPVSAFTGDYSRLRRITPGGTISLLAGVPIPLVGPLPPTGDGGPATQAAITGPTDILAAPDGSVYYTDSVQHSVRRISPTGTISRVAGNGVFGFSGDGGPATNAMLASAAGLALTPTGELLFIDAGNLRVRRVDADGNIDTIAGTGVEADTGDGGPALQATFRSLGDLAVASDGSIFVSDIAANRIRRIAPDGTIHAYAGTGLIGATGDGGPATAARTRQPTQLATAPDGSLLFIDSGNHRIRRITADGVIRTVAGNGTQATSPDGSPPTSPIKGPQGLGFHEGEVYFSEAGSNLVRKFRLSAPVPVIFLPGILGSEVWCAPAARNGQIWPAVPVDDARLRLLSDGETNASADCPAAGIAEPEYDAQHRLVPGRSGIAESLLGEDIYGSALTRLATTVGAKNFYAFPWDWRKDTAASLARLDALVEQVKTETGASRVQLVAHSYGGLMARHYASDPVRRDKLARVTTVGTPYWGSPKSIFPLVLGREMPFNGAVAVGSMEFLFGGRSDLQSTATTLQGLYNLWPSAAYGSFLTVGGRTPAPLDGPGLGALIIQSGGFVTQWLAAQTRHADDYDQLDVGNLPWRAIVSGGEPTVRRIVMAPGASEDDQLTVGITLGPGDGTVPLRSQRLGTEAGGALPGTGTDLAVRELCASKHMGQMSDPALYTLIAGWLSTGTAIAESASTPCRAQRALVIDAIDADIPEPGGAPSPRARSGQGTGTAPLTVAEAEAAGHVEVLRFGRQHLILVDPASSVALRLTPRAGATLSVVARDVDGEAAAEVGRASSSGSLTLTAAAGGSVAFAAEPSPPAPAPSTESLPVGAAPTPGSSTPSSGSAPTPTPKPPSAVRLEGRTLRVVGLTLRRSKSSARCPKNASARIVSSVGRRSRTVTKRVSVRAAGSECTVSLVAKVPKGTARVRLTVTGSGLRSTRVTVRPV